MDMKPHKQKKHPSFLTAERERHVFVGERYQ